MLKAIHYCHRVIKVIHRDIKPDNIMINHNNEAVLIDFGVSALVDQQEDDALKNTQGSYMFFAPEMFNRKDKNTTIRGEMTDLWALGVSIYFMIAGKFPFDEGKNNLMLLKELICEKPINFDCIKHEPVK